MPDEFIKYVIHSQKSQLNAHWKHFSSLCHPCHIKYDYVGKFESFDSDVNYILEKLGQNHVQFPSVAASKKTSRLLNSSYTSVLAQDYNMLLDMYALDFEMFGYTKPAQRNDTLNRQLNLFTSEKESPLY